MGLLERWDTSNQRTLEYQNEEPQRSTSTKTLVKIWIVVAVVCGALRVALPPGLAIGVMCVLAIGCFVWTAAVARGRRSTWDRRH